MIYYDTATKTATSTQGATTIPSDDTRVAAFFAPLPAGKMLDYDVNGLPLIVDIPPLTPEQEAANALAAKWKLVDDYMATLEVTSDVSVGGNKFKADPEGIRNIESATHGMVSTSTKYWVEDWGSFTTDITEMEWVLKEAQRLKEAKIIEVGL